MTVIKVHLEGYKHQKNREEKSPNRLNFDGEKADVAEPKLAGSILDSQANSSFDARSMARLKVW